MQNKNLFNPQRTLIAASLIGASLFFTACGDDEPGISKIDAPSSYSFTRDGASTVAYDGQTSRLNQLAEIKAYLGTGDKGELLEAQVLKDMFANTNGNGNGNFSQTYSKQLKDKTFEPDRAYFEDLMDAAATASEDGNGGFVASNGQAGLLLRDNGNTILVDGMGREFTQYIEKGLMGATFYYQICETYLTDERIGNAVENDDVEEGANYTSMEHHWDEAFGYFGVPVDFPANTTNVRFWGNYSNGRDALIGTNALLMNAFIEGRTAIVNKEYAERDVQRDVIYEELERVCAATAIHYINEALSATSDGDRLHVLSEAYVFTRDLKYSSRRQISLAQINDILENKIGENLWETTATGLNEAKDLLASIYGLEAVKNDL